jgi:hypothetical protein
MTRRATHGSSKRAKQPVTKLLETILDDVLAARAIPTDEWRQLWPDPFTSMAIPAGRGREHPCTQTGMRHIRSRNKAGMSGRTCARRSRASRSRSWHSMRSA